MKSEDEGESPAGGYCIEFLDVIEAMLEEGDTDAVKVWKDCAGDVNRLMFRLFRKSA